MNKDSYSGLLGNTINPDKHFIIFGHMFSVKHFSLCWLALMTCLFSGGFVQAQDSFEEVDDVNIQIWSDYNPSFIINTGTQIYGDIGFRTIFPGVWYRGVLRPAVRYDITRYNDKTERYRTWQLHGGMGFFYTYNLEATNILEIRPFQGLRVRIPNWNRFQLVHYLRFEERFEFGLQGGGSEFSIRSRYLVGNDFFLPGKYLVKGLYIPVYAEFFFNMNRGAQFNDLIRLTPGIGYRPNQNFKVQLDISYHRRRPSSDLEFRTNDIVARLRVYQRF